MKENPMAIKPEWYSDYELHHEAASYSGTTGRVSFGVWLNTGTGEWAWYVKYRNKIAKFFEKESAIDFYNECVSKRS